MAATGGALIGTRRRFARSPFYTLLGLLLLLLAIAGFWPQYFSAVTGRAPVETARFWLIHLHAALFTFWLLLYIAQAALVMSGRTRTHMKLGPWGAGYGFAIAAVGLFAAGVLASRLGVREHDMDAAASFVIFPLIDMLFLASFLAVAVVWRNRPQIHKRAMFLATFSIAVVGLDRLVGRTGIENPLIWQPLMLAPLLIAIGYDAIVCRKLYPIMALGLLAHLARLNLDHFSTTEAWLPIGRSLLAPFR